MVKGELRVQKGGKVKCGKIRVRQREGKGGRVGKGEWVTGEGRVEDGEEVRLG